MGAFAERHSFSEQWVLLKAVVARTRVNASVALRARGPWCGFLQYWKTAIVQG